MLSNNSIVAVFNKTPLVSKDGRTYGFRCNISQSYAKKDELGNTLIDENGRRTYIQDFSGNVKFLGDAYIFMKDKEIPDGHPLRIRVDNMGVKTFTINVEDNGETKKKYCTDILVFKASDIENKRANDVNDSYTSDEELPFA